MLRRTRSQVAVACCCLVLFAGCSGGSGGGYATPDACFDGIRDSLAKKDYKGALNSVTDESQNIVAAGMVMAGTMIQAFSGMAAAMGGDEEAAKAKEAVAAIAKVMDKHGINEDKLKSLGEETNPMMGMGDEAAMAKIAGLLSDKSGFILDMAQALSSMGDGPGPSPQEMIDALASAKLTDLKIDGDKATATIVAADKPPAPIAFRKSADGWKLHIDLEAMKAGDDGEMSGPEFGGEFGGGEYEADEAMDEELEAIEQ
ncbi:MAG: hypothetical protein KF847_10880 [Pirellulales bacterium]|nr:hypothetical protein [Pirellulales bacterium]